ncbi:hypothetical protein DSO57_1000904 [Entomophthora muscae]|uniref:Uncharacterized protein n=1 Tax=Entomophthora muscae TaxID=34485 RepID=A0ACC2SYD8_9FUNG|nr:hypothetical protein DSO57_1000904 [Entomophthora muscae]
MRLEIIQLLVILVVNAQKSTKCNSPLYCDGKFLKAIQMNQVLKDGKEIVDRATKKPLADVVKAFGALKDTSKESLKIFVDENFHEAGYEVEKVEIKDFDDNPAFLKNISDQIFRGFAKQIHNLWNTLIRRQNTTKLCEGCVSSLLNTSRNFIVAGGRFREFYYWDSYFALEGTNQGGLFNVSRDMILNLLDFVKDYGFVPNGARIYFLTRSQPPLLTQMVKQYIKASKDKAFIKENIKTLDKEYDYWIKNHNIKVDCPDTKQDCFLTRYVVNNTLPRPESYREDVETALPLAGDMQKQLYADLAAGAESGWDFSSRWVPGSKGNKKLLASQETTLRGIRTSDIVPVDLNAIMYANEKAMHEFHVTLSKDISPNKDYHMDKMQMYKQAYETRSKLMASILWDKDSLSFYDYNIKTKQLNKEFFPSNIWPFWAEAVHSSIAINKNIISAFNHVQDARKPYPGGVPTSETKGSLLQWDYPNTWAPLEYMVVESGLNAMKLLKDQQSQAQVKTITHQVAQTYVNTTFCAWYNSGGSVQGSLPKKAGLSEQQTGYMYEKYNVTVMGGAGGGGEYEIQTGFGWSNGVLIHLLGKFGHEFHAPEKPEEYCNHK